MRRFLLGLALFIGCRQPPHGRDFVADFEACAKLEGEPTRYEHSAVTKCLVDRYGWPLDMADRRADSMVTAFYQRVDSLQKTVDDSITAARLEGERKVDSVMKAFNKELWKPLKVP